MTSDEFLFEMRRGRNKMLIWIGIPFLVISLIALLSSGIVLATQMKNIPNGPPNILSQEQTQATTDLYADSVLDAMNCMRNGETGGCNINDLKSNMLKNITGGKLDINGQTYYFTNKDELKQVIQGTVLKELSYVNLDTTQRGRMEKTINYSNDEETVKLTFVTRPNQELELEKIDVTPKG